MEVFDPTETLRIQIPTPRSEYSHITKKRYKTMVFILVQIVVIIILLSGVLYTVKYPS